MESEATAGETPRTEEAPGGTPGGEASGGEASGGGTPAEETSRAEEIRTALRGVKDPELGFNIVDLGLVYDVELEGDEALVTMTLTSPGCPAGGQILAGAKEAAESVEGVESARVNLVWKPFWTPDRIDPKIRAAMGF